MTKTLTRRVRRGGAWGTIALAALGAGCRATEQPGERKGPEQGPAASGLPAVESPRGVARPPFRFTPEDERLLDEVQRGAFLYLWNECSAKTGMVRDRSSEPVISIAGVGFQLSALPVGVERGWVTRDQARERALLILKALEENAANRHAGLFFHYLDPETAAPYKGAYEHTVSTIDSALLLAGMLTAGSYFGGEVRQVADGLVEAADWRAFVLTEGEKPHELGYVSLGWQPERKRGGAGLLPYVWADCGDEQRLVMFLAVAAPREEHRLEPALYYKLRRRLGDDGEGPMAWFPWSGALFTSFFAHCWINYGSMGPDNPEAFGVKHRARVDWWENARRAAAMHKRKCAANPLELATLKSGAWGLSASDTPKGYAVPGLFPTPIDMGGAEPEFDYSPYRVKDDYGDGTVPPYAAGCCIMFDPTGAVAALRLYKGLKDSAGAPLVWREPDASKRQYGFQDAFNLGKMWAAKDCVAIDQGPLLLAIENARTGLIWKVFASHPAVAAGMERLGMGRRARSGSR